MVVPIGLGAWLDSAFGWSPWGVVVGAVLGLVVGFTHLLVMLNKRSKAESENRSEQKPP